MSILSAIRRGLLAALNAPQEQSTAPEPPSDWEGAVPVTGWVYIITPEGRSFELPMPAGSRLCLSATRRYASEMMEGES